eukprot:382297_1
MVLFNFWPSKKSEHPTKSQFGHYNPMDLKHQTVNFVFLLVVAIMMIIGHCMNRNCGRIGILDSKRVNLVVFDGIQVFGCVAKSVLFVCFGLFGAKVMTQVVINTNKRIPIDIDASRRSVLYGIEAFAKKKSLKAIDADTLQKEAVAAPQLSANAPCANPFIAIRIEKLYKQFVIDMTSLFDCAFCFA